MGFNPIEIIRSQEVTQYKHLESHKAQHEQVQIGKSFQNMVQTESSRPNQTVKSENKEFRYDAKEKGSNDYSGNPGKHKQKKDKKEESKEPKKSGGIDIRI